MSAAAPRIGLISDTHGLLRREAVDALEGVDRILHAGDVGRPEILEALERIAPTIAVRGNVDRDSWAARLPEIARIEIAGVRFVVLHVRDDLEREPSAGEVDVVVFGHSHVPSVEERHGVLWINPGSAGPRRFRLPVTIARIEIEGRLPRGRIVPLPLSHRLP